MPPVEAVNEVWQAVAPDLACQPGSASIAGLTLMPAPACPNRLAG